MEKNELFRNIPKVDVLLERESMAALIGRYGRALVTEERDLWDYLYEAPSSSTR